jgi:hypothetical protein
VAVRTKNGDHLVILDDLQAAGDDEAKRVDGLAGMVEQVPGRRVRHLEVHSERAQAAVGGEPERWVLVEHFAVQMHADVCLHIFWAVIQHLPDINMLQ